MKTKLKPITLKTRVETDKLYRKYKDMVFNHVLRVVKHQHDAEDVTTDVFAKIMRLSENKLTQFDENRSSIKTWIYTITNSVILDFFRTNHQDKYKAVSDFVDSDNEQKSYFTFVAPEYNKTDNEVLTSEFHNTIAKAFRTLKPKYRKIAILYFLRDLPYIEIANIVNVPIGTVKGMLSRSRTKLQNELKGIYTLRSMRVEMSKT